MNLEFHKNILLTGAGYTANYGGYLAKDFWSMIINNPKRLKLSNAAQKVLLNSGFNYEAIYSDIIDHPQASDLDKELIREIIIDIYENLDIEIKNTATKASNMRSKWGRTLIQQFIGRGDKKGFWFTLNQDLLEESRSGIKAFGISNSKTDKLTTKQPLDRKDFVELPTQEEVEQLKQRISGPESSKGTHIDLNDLNYFKLHGSYGWLSGNGNDALVFGRNKPKDIQSEPLLSFYLDTFREVLNQDNAKLLIIGYSFGDDHINEKILDGVKKGLRVFIINPSLEDIRDKLCWTPQGKEALLKQEAITKPIWDRQLGSIPKKLIDIFEDDNNGNINREAENLINIFC